MQDPNRWKQVKGPIAATMSVLLDLGWVPMRPDMWKDPEGLFFCMRGTVYRDPSRQRLIAHYEELKHAIRRDALKYVWDSRPKVGNHKGPEGAYDVSIVRDLVKFLRKEGKHDLAGALRMAACDGIPNRNTLYNKGLVESPMCLLCNAEPDSATHRYWQCRSLGGCEADYVAITSGLAGHHSPDNEMMWNRALIPCSWHPTPDPIDDSLDFLHGPAAGFQDLSLFYSDGSGGVHSRDPLLRRCGWGFIGMDHLTPLVGKGGGLPGYMQTVPRAELYAVIALLRLRPQGSFTRIGVDCKYIVTGSLRSPALVATRDNADLWEEYFSLINAKNLEVRIFKIYKSHCGIGDITSGRISLQDFLGNTFADAFARRGAAAWAFPWDMEQTVQFLRGRAWKIGLRIASVSLTTAKAYKGLVDAKPVSRPKPKCTEQDLLTQLSEIGHEMVHSERKDLCTKCGLSCL